VAAGLLAVSPPSYDGANGEDDPRAPGRAEDSARP
jgi:hypothetical protein